MTTRTRFAPSPTGLMHPGNARTALFNALLARSRQGEFVLRIEDTDASRDDSRHETALREDLKWLGAQWDAGPDIGGPAGPYRQSERHDIYAGLYRQLRDAGLAYPCFCTQQQLSRARAAQRAAGKPPRYPGTCAKLDPAEAAERIAAGEAATLRFRVPTGRTVSFTDLVRGEQHFASDDIGDFIIQRADGTPAFFFSNAVDDALMGVTHALRGEDHIANTPRQLLLLEALDLHAPEYGHFALVTGEDGGPLSKRAGDISLHALRERGFRHEAVLNYLARLGHAMDDNRLLKFDRLAVAFDVGHLGRAPARFDEVQLRHWQRLAVESLDADALTEWLEPTCGANVPAEAMSAFVTAVQPNILFPEDAQAWAQIVFAAPDSPDENQLAALSVAGPAFFSAARQALAEHGTDYRGLTGALKTATGTKGKQLFMPLRLALTGRDKGPELAALLPLIGRDAADARFAHWEQALNPA